MKEEDLLNKIIQLIPPDYLELREKDFRNIQKDIRINNYEWYVPEYSICSYAPFFNTHRYIRIGNFLILFSTRKILLKDTCIFEDNKYTNLEQEFINWSNINSPYNKLKKDSQSNIYYIVPQEIKNLSSL